MSVDQDFEAECMRAELLGLPKPDKESFAINKISPSTLCSDDEDEQTHPIDNRFLEEINLDGENIKQASGGLDELNNILAVTQKKLNNFKSACGNLSNLLKIRLRGSEPNSNDASPCPSPAPTKKFDNQNSGEGVEQTACANPNPPDTRTQSQKRMDFDREMSNQVDKLDSMLSKADNAVYSMSAQNKQMKKFLQ
nr:PREDICTED: uncharacterized protein LOC109039882 [Bemisia tabaci]